MSTDDTEQGPTPDIKERLLELAPDLDDEHIAQLGRFLALLAERNQQFNLTAVRDPQEMWERHVLGSLALLPWLPEAGHVFDLGSGGGLPAIPLATVRPASAYVLVESVGKKARFLQEATDTLQLRDVQVLAERIETVGRSARREGADTVTARALARLPVLLELAIPLLKVGGRLLAIKGEQAEQEVRESARALRELHAEVEDLKPTATGTVVIVRKRKATPARFPRKPGEPKRRPLE